MKARHPLLLLCAGLLASGLANAERRDHGAHVHGVAAMDVAALDGEVEIALRSPAMNLVGFEHEPRTDEEHERMREALEALHDGAVLFTFGEAGCRLREARVQHGHAREHEHGEHDEHARGDEDHGHDDDHAHGAEHGDGHENEHASHSEIHAHYRFACEGSVASIETRLFERFPRTESIRVPYLTDESQGAQTLTADAPVLRLE